jgi:hypothetical protein
MDNTAWRLLAKQLTETGFGDVVTAGLRTRMNKGDEQVEVPFRKWFDGDEVQGGLQLRKPERSDYYALDAFDIRLRKAGHTDWLQQTFQQSGGAYTLQEAYNLMSGRPVYKQLEGTGVKPYEAWLKLDFDRKLENGNYARKYYHADDGFNLESVLNRYPVTELAEAGPRKELIETLKRGDLARVTMAGAEGVERKLFISPSIATRSLLVQDENGIRMSPEKLAGGSVPRVSPVAETTPPRREMKQLEDRKPALRRAKRQRLS